MVARELGLRGRSTAGKCRMQPSQNRDDSNRAIGGASPRRSEVIGIFFSETGEFRANLGELSVVG